MARLLPFFFPPSPLILNITSLRSLSRVDYWPPSEELEVQLQYRYTTVLHYAHTVGVGGVTYLFQKEKYIHVKFGVINS